MKELIFGAKYDEGVWLLAMNVHYLEPWIEGKGDGVYFTSCQCCRYGCFFSVIMSISSQYHSTMLYRSPLFSKSFSCILLVVETKHTLVLVVQLSMICRTLYRSPNLYRSSRTTLHLSGSSPHHRDPFTSCKSALPKAFPTVHVGTSYEHLCARTLPRLHFQDLTRTGGRADKGIDLLGKWLPVSLQYTKSPPLNVVVQCKAVARKAGPEMIRELEGALFGAPGEWSGEDTIGVLCAKKEVTAGVRDALRRSKRGMVWLMVEDLDVDKKGRSGDEVEEVVGVSKETEEGKEGRIRQVLWNDRVQKLVGEDTGTSVIHMPGENGEGMETEVLLSWNGMVAVPNHGSGGGGLSRSLLSMIGQLDN